MIKWLISHQWKESLRSPIFQKNLIINIVIGFFIVLMVVQLLGLGFLIRPILQEVRPEEDPIKLFNGFLIFYVLINLLMRFLVQGVPVMKIEPYLHLPINKKRIVHFFLLKSKFSVFNFLALILFLPISINLIGYFEGFVSGLTFLIGMMLIELTINYTNIYFKKQIHDKPMIPIAFALLIGVLLILNRYDVISIDAFSTNIFEYFVSSPFALIVPAAILAFVYWLNYRYFYEHTYPEELAYSKKSQTQTSKRFIFLEKYGQIGQMLLMDIRLIFRHKRTRSLAIMAVVFVAYGLFFYTSSAYDESWGMYLFGGIFMSGLFMMSFGNFLLSWYSNFFDGLLTLNFDSYNFFRSKYWLFFVFCTVTFLLTIPYVYFGTHALLINFCTYLYNIGVNSFVVMYFATVGPKRIDLSKGHAFNWEGMTGAQFLAMLPMLILPIMIYWPISFFTDNETGIIAVGIVGLVNLLFTKIWLKQLSKRLQTVKYKIAEGFRQG